MNHYTNPTRKLFGRTALAACVLCVFSATTTAFADNPAKQTNIPSEVSGESWEKGRSIRSVDLQGTSVYNKNREFIGEVTMLTNRTNGDTPGVLVEVDKDSELSAKHLFLPLSTVAYHKPAGVLVVFKSETKLKQYSVKAKEMRAFKENEGSLEVARTNASTSGKDSKGEYGIMVTRAQYAKLSDNPHLANFDAPSARRMGQVTFRNAEAETGPYLFEIIVSEAQAIEFFQSDDLQRQELVHPPHSRADGVAYSDSDSDVRKNARGGSEGLQAQQSSGLRSPLALSEALEQEFGKQVADIDVRRSDRGIVVLEGTVPSREVKDRVLKFARDRYTRRVVSEIEISQT
ncbi:MAG: BON domain-containing protein [Opitutales bacterium]